MRAFHSEQLAQEAYQGFEQSIPVRNCKVFLHQDQTGTCPVMSVNGVTHHQLRDRVVSKQAAESFLDFDIAEPCTADAATLLGLREMTTRDYGGEELRKMDVVHNEYGVHEDARWLARYDTQVWGEHVFFNGVRYLLKATDRKENGRYARTYKIVERVIVDPCEDPDIFNPETDGKLAHQQQAWYRQMNDDHRGLDYYEKLWAEDDILFPTDVAVHENSVEFCCPEHCLEDGDYISVPLVDEGVHTVTTDGQWLSIETDDTAEEDIEKIEQILRKTKIAITTMHQARQTTIDHRDSHYDGISDPESQMELKLDNLEQDDE